MELNFCYVDRAITSEEEAAKTFILEKDHQRFYSVEFKNNIDITDEELHEGIIEVLMQYFPNEKYNTSQWIGSFYDTVNIDEIDEGTGKDRFNYDSFMARFVTFKEDCPSREIETVKVPPLDTNANYVCNLGHVDIRRVIFSIIQSFADVISNITISDRHTMNGFYEWNYTDISLTDKQAEKSGLARKIEGKKAGDSLFYANLKMYGPMGSVVGYAAFTDLFDCIKTNYSQYQYTGFPLDSFTPSPLSKNKFLLNITKVDKLMYKFNGQDILPYYGTISLDDKSKYQGIFCYATESYDASNVQWSENITVGFGLVPKYVIKIEDEKVTEVIIKDVKQGFFLRRMGGEYIDKDALRRNPDGLDGYGFSSLIYRVNKDHWEKVSDNVMFYINDFRVKENIDKDCIKVKQSELSDLILKEGEKISPDAAVSYFNRFEKDLLKRILMAGQFEYNLHSGDFNRKFSANRTDSVTVNVHIPNEAELKAVKGHYIKDIYYCGTIAPGNLEKTSISDFGIWKEKKYGYLVIETIKGELRIGSLNKVDIATIVYKDEKGRDVRVKLKDIFAGVQNNAEDLNTKKVFKKIALYLDKLSKKESIVFRFYVAFVLGILKTEDFIIFLEYLIKTLSTSDVGEGVIDDSLDDTFEYVKNIIYPSEMGFIADPEVVAQVCDEWEKFNDTGVVPNLVIMGEAGIGKSKLANNIASLFVSKPIDGSEIIEYKTPSDFKGAYVGHTSGRVYDMIKSVAEINRQEIKRVIFVDEAYHFQNDTFGSEAIDIILPLLSGDRKYIEKAESKDSGPERYDFEGTSIPPIWLAGYEQPMREMLSINPGLYRRITKITLSSPSVKDLFEALLRQADLRYKADCEKYRLESNRKPIDFVQIFKDNEKVIKNYFAWAIVPDYSEYFANYAGVENFYELCRVRMGRVSSSGGYAGCILDVINVLQTEVKKQYTAIINKDKDTAFKFPIETDIETVFDDIRGVEDNGEELPAKKALKEILNMLVDKKKYIMQGIKIPKGALLVGPPGTGKTMFARALAGELQRNIQKNADKSPKLCFIHVNATELDHPAKIKALFASADKYDECILFIDEIDAIGINRQAFTAKKDLLITLMTELDGFTQNTNIFVLAATNDPDHLDPALKRPGRFDRIVEVSYMGKSGRKDIARYHINSIGSDIINKTDDPDLDIDAIAEEMAKETRGYAAAEIINVLNEAAILNRRCLMEDIDSISNMHRTYKGKDALLHKNLSFLEDIREIIERLEVGHVNINKRDKEFKIDKNNMCTTAVALHEVGHGIASVLLGKKPFDKITTISRGTAAGYVKLDSEERSYTRKELLDGIIIDYAGRVVEEMFYGMEEVSVGASADIRNATRVATCLVTMYGMSDNIGPMALMRRTESYLQAEKEYICSDSFREKVDSEVNSLLKEQLKKTRELLEPYKEKIETLARKVFEEESMSGEEFIAECEKLGIGKV